MNLPMNGQCLCALITVFTLLHAAQAAEPATANEHMERAHQAAANRESQRAVTELNAVVQLEPMHAEAYYLRGRERLRLGQFAESVTDFDRYLELRPAVSAQMWERGIACYYAGKFAEGAAQFAAYQRYDGNDVENAVWHLLCRARQDGLPAAQKDALRVRQDGRVPMMQVNELFRGRLSVEQVLEAAEKETEPGQARTAARFYANLYIGLFYDVTGNTALARKHLRAAVMDHRIDNYMWDVAKVHLQQLDKASIQGN